MSVLEKEYQYKHLLFEKISKFVCEITLKDHEIGIISNNMIHNMTEAAWLIVKQNIDSNEINHENNT